VTDPEFDEFLAERVDALERKQADLTVRFGLGTHARWDYDQTTGRLAFSDAAGRVVVEADVTPIGSWSAAGPDFRWAWANPSFLEPARTRAARLRGLHEATDGLECFHAEVFECEEETAWQLAALAVDHLGAAGCYQAPAGCVAVFLALDAVRSLADAASVTSSGIAVSDTPVSLSDKNGVELAEVGGENRIGYAMLLELERGAVTPTHGMQGFFRRLLGSKGGIMRLSWRVALLACLLFVPACTKKASEDDQKAPENGLPKMLTKEHLFGAWKGKSERGVTMELTFSAPQGNDSWGPCRTVFTESNPDRLSYMGTISYKIEPEMNQIRFNSLGQEDSEGATAKLTADGDLLVSGSLLSRNSPEDKRPETRLHRVEQGAPKK